MNRDYWTYVEIAELFDVSVDTLRRKITAWEAQGFPRPLPWSARPLRWNPDAVRAWKTRREIAAQAIAHQLKVVPARA